MAPRTRSNRAEKLQVEKLLASGKSVNSIGLAGLPNELFLELMEHLRPLSTPTFAWEKHAYEPDCHFTLLSLSQTCQTLRFFFLRYAWKCIEVRDGKKSSTGYLSTAQELRKRGWSMKSIHYKKHFEETARQFETVTIRNPDLAQYVREIDLSLPGQCSSEVMEEIAESIAMLPNVHTLQLHLDFKESPFQQRLYPSIHTLRGGRLMPHLIPACPNVVRVTNSEPGKWWNYGRDLIRLCPNVQQIGPLDGSISVLDLLKNLRQVRDVTVATAFLRNNEADLPKLSKMEHLHTIRLDLTMSSSRWPPLPVQNDERVRFKKALYQALASGLSNGTKKRLILIRKSGTVETTEIRAK